MVTTEEVKVICDPGSDEDFLNRVYQSELGREPDGEGFKYWLDDLNIRGETREKVLTNIRLSEEYKLKNSEA